MSKIKTNNWITMKGTPTLTLRDADGNIIQKYTSNNLIVKVGRSALIKLLTGDLSSHITQCAVGTDGVDAGDAFLPIAPTENDTALYAEVAGSRKNIDGYEYEVGTTPTMVTFTTLFTSLDVNAIVSEAGLFFDDGTMFARYTFPSMYLKDDKGYSLEIAWEIQL